MDVLPMIMEHQVEFTERTKSIFKSFTGAEIRRGDINGFHIDRAQKVIFLGCKLL